MDMTFLDGYFQPALLLLHQPLATGNPLLYMRTNSFVATLVTFDVASGTFATLWRLDNLPHDSLQLVPVPATIRPSKYVQVDVASSSSSSSSSAVAGAEGAMLVTTNSIYYLHPRYCSGAHLNGFSDFSAVRADVPVCLCDRVRACACGCVCACVAMSAVCVRAHLMSEACQRQGSQRTE